VQAVDVLKYAITRRPKDAHAHLQLGNLLAGLGRLDEALEHWKTAAQLKPSLGMAFRNLGVYQSTTEENLAAAEDSYRKAISASPGDQTLYRDLAEILLAAGRRPEAIKLLETMPLENVRRAEIIIILAQAYFDEKRFDETLALLESTPYFVNWEGQDITWVLFNRAHAARGRKSLASGNFEAALKEFETALTYPENLGVGRPYKPQEAVAQYWRGKALEALGRTEEAKAAWTAGAAGAKGSEEQEAHVKLCQEALRSNR
jgi:tetratricopeptide (TPR) repeat protein